MNNIKTLFTFNSKEICIVLFNNVLDQKNILFLKSIKIDDDVILNGYISNNKIVSEIISTLVDEAQKFTDFKIENIYVNVDCNEITIKPFESTGINLEDKIFDKNIWNQIEQNITISQITDKYIYDINYVSWIIDKQEYFEINNNSIAGNELIIKANIYQINKILYNNYNNLFDKLNLHMINLFPMINTFSTLIQNNKQNHYELFVYINNDALTIVQSKAKNIQRCISDKKLGLNNLYDVISRNTGLDINIVKKNINTVLFNNEQDYKFIDRYDIDQNKLSQFNIRQFKKYIEKYVESIAEIVNLNVDYLKENKDILITKITYIPTSKITKNLINLTQIHHQSNVYLFNDNNLIETENYAVQQNLMIDFLNYQCNNNIYQKRIKNIFKNNYKKEFNKN